MHQDFYFFFTLLLDQASAVVAAHRHAAAQIVRFLFRLFGGDTILWIFLEARDKSLRQRNMLIKKMHPAKCTCVLQRPGCVFLEVTFERCEGPAEASQVQSRMIPKCSCPPFCIGELVRQRKDSAIRTGEENLKIFGQSRGVGVFTCTGINIPGAAGMYSGTNSPCNCNVVM